MSGTFSYPRTKWIAGLILVVVCTLAVLRACPAAGYAYGWMTCHWLSTECPVEISVYSSDTKEEWIDAAATAFNARQVRTSKGRAIRVTVYHVKSGGSMQDILAGKIQPTAWSPGEQSWANSLNQKWREREGRPIITEPCSPTIYAPVGFAMFRPMAKVLGWPDKPIGWDTLLTLAADPQGWAAYGHPEWGQFKFGHTHPDYSNSGLLILTSLANAVVDKTQGLTAEDVRSDAVVDAMRTLELITDHYGISSKDNIVRMVEDGPKYLHATNATEAETLRANAGEYGTARFPLVFIFPAGGTFWAEHPYCVLDADWSSDEKREAARMFREYLLTSAQQELAITFFLRPRDPSIPLTHPFTIDNGTDPNATPATVRALGSPSTEVTDAIKEVFRQTKKKATTVILLDISGSMAGQKLMSAREATADFIAGLEPLDEMYIYAFNDAVAPLKPFGPAEEVRGELAQSLNEIQAFGGTALYDAICTGVGRASELRAADRREGERRLYGVVVLSDGEDTASSVSQAEMLDCLPVGEGAEGVKVFTIAYGADAVVDLLQTIADRANGKAYAADPDTIQQVYREISAQQ